MSLHITNPGFLSLIQDFGREGFQHIGVTTGGPLDEHAFLWANHLLDNDINAAQIEISVGMFAAEFTQACTIALTGADMAATLNGQAIKPWRTYNLNPGDRLNMATATTGMRAYLAVKGGFEVTPQLQSCATVMRERIGGLDQQGSKLQAQDQIGFQPGTATLTRRVPQQFIPDYSADLELGVIPGYQYDSFSLAQINRFFSEPYRISTEIDRMGYRLSGAAVNSSLDGIISEGISYGAIQIPKDGQPIVLLKDRQTIGGYPKIGCVTSLDAARLSQRGPGTQVRFKPVSVEQATAERMIYNHFFGI